MYKSKISCIVLCFVVAGVLLLACNHDKEETKKYYYEFKLISVSSDEMTGAIYGKFNICNYGQLDIEIPASQKGSMIATKPEYEINNNGQWIHILTIYNFIADNALVRGGTNQEIEINLSSLYRDKKYLVMTEDGLIEKSLSRPFEARIKLGEIYSEAFWVNDVYNNGIPLTP